jgi:cell division protein FtsI (penicillin-binding protein 3)
VPNVVDMTLSDALFLLENHNMKVVARGRGKVNAQSVPPGTIVGKGHRIELEMSIL